MWTDSLCRDPDSAQEPLDLNLLELLRPEHIAPTLLVLPQLRTSRLEARLTDGGSSKGDPRLRGEQEREEGSVGEVDGERGESRESREGQDGGPLARRRSGGRKKGGRVFGVRLLGHEGRGRGHGRWAFGGRTSEGWEARSNGAGAEMAVRVRRKARYTR